jgi:hypothetical protein
LIGRADVTLLNAGIAREAARHTESVELACAGASTCGAAACSVLRGDVARIILVVTHAALRRAALPVVAAADIRAILFVALDVACSGEPGIGIPAAAVLVLPAELSGHTAAARGLADLDAGRSVRNA